jgi:hypothetical protein
MEPQEILDTVARHLFRQGRRAVEPVDSFASCRYRTPSGDKCAVGALIPDEMYDPTFENVRVSVLIRHRGCDLPDWFAENAVLLAELQGVHDNPMSWADTQAMRYALTCVAGRFGLSTGVIDSLSFDGR